MRAKGKLPHWVRAAPFSLFLPPPLLSLLLPLPFLFPLLFPLCSVSLPPLSFLFLSCRQWRNLVWWGRSCTAKYDYGDSGNDVTGADVAGARPSIPDGSRVRLIQMDTHGGYVSLSVHLSTPGPTG